MPNSNTILYHYTKPPMLFLKHEHTFQQCICLLMILYSLLEYKMPPPTPLCFHQLVSGWWSFWGGDKNSKRSQSEEMCHWEKLLKAIPDRSLLQRCYAFALSSPLSVVFFSLYRAIDLVMVFTQLHASHCTLLMFTSRNLLLFPLLLVPLTPEITPLSCHIYSYVQLSLDSIHKTRYTILVAPPCPLPCSLRPPPNQHPSVLMPFTGLKLDFYMSESL